MNTQMQAFYFFPLELENKLLGYSSAAANSILGRKEQNQHQYVYHQYACPVQHALACSQKLIFCSFNLNSFFLTLYWGIGD